MDAEIFPRHYDAWKVCITKKCKNILLQETMFKSELMTFQTLILKPQNYLLKNDASHWKERILGYFRQSLNDSDLK